MMVMMRRKTSIIINKNSQDQSCSLVSSVDSSSASKPGLAVGMMR